MPGRRIARRRQHEPVEAVGRQGQQVGELADRREQRAAAELDRYVADELRQVDLDRLRRARDIGNAENRLTVEAAQISQYLAVLRIEEAQIAATEGGMRAADRQHPAHPVEQ